MFYSDNQLAQIDLEFQQLPERYRTLIENYTFRAYVNPKAREQAWHDFDRRLAVLVQCIGNIFDIMRPSPS